MSWSEESTPAARPDAPEASGPVVTPLPRGARGRFIARLEAAGSYPTWVLFAALAGMFATTFPVTILTVSLPAMAVEFGVTETTIAWVISAPMAARDSRRKNTLA